MNAGASVVVRDPGAQPGEHEWCIAIANNHNEVGEFVPIECVKACDSVHAMLCCYNS